jgi:hypothetical protein
MKFYYGVFSWGGQEFIGKHQAIITQEIYEKANNI